MAEFWFTSGPESLSREDLLTLIGVQGRAIAELKARVAQLERRLGRNSGNSSMPPSSDAFTKPVKQPMVKSGRKRGRQAALRFRTGAGEEPGRGGPPVPGDLRRLRRGFQTL